MRVEPHTGHSKNMQGLKRERVEDLFWGLGFSFWEEQRKKWRWLIEGFSEPGDDFALLLRVAEYRYVLWKQQSAILVARCNCHTFVMFLRVLIVFSFALQFEAVLLVGLFSCWNSVAIQLLYYWDVSIIHICLFLCSYCRKNFLLVYFWHGIDC